jgi:Uma2 family endonuclease
MALPEYPYIDVEDYLALDNTVRSVRYEYIDGTLRMLAGGSPDHAIIAANLTTTLNYALRGKPCIVYSADVRFKLSESRYVHPDVTVSCDPRDKYKKDNIQYPRIIVEVLSPSTEAIGRGEKLEYYLDFPTMEEYILIGSQRKFVEVYHRDNNIWTSRVYKSTDTIYLKSIRLEITFVEIYDKTSLENS